MLIRGMTRAVFAAENEGGGAAAEPPTPEEIANKQIAEVVKAAESGAGLANAGTKDDEPVAAVEDDKDAAEDEGAEGEEAPKQTDQAPEWMKKQIGRQHARLQDEKRENEKLRLENAALKKAGLEPKPTGDSSVPVAGEESSDGGRIQRGQFGSKAEFDAAVKTQAAQDRAVADYNSQCEAASATGIKTFGEKEFAAALGNLQLAGGFDPDTMQAVLASDEPSKVLFELGKNVDEFTRIMELPHAKRTYEIAKIAMKTPPKKKVSEAPAPVEQVGARGVKVSGVDPSDPDQSDKISNDDEWYAKREKQRHDKWVAKQNGRAVA